MAKSNAVWGIDIGQCALKAMRCVPHDDESKMEVVAFDYIEYPKILSQAEANPDELIAEALTTFLSRNDVQGDRVAISVSGQIGLARFIKLPPVEQKKIPDIVKYEARQQIPFALEDVIWDYQEMGGSSEEEGFALETEVGLFAMKRDQVFESLQPFEDAGIDVDIIQLTPLALYNYIVFDQMRDLPPPEEYDPENPPPSVIVISIGTDTTDLVVTNGYKVWQRSVPLGGNHFTKTLTKQLKLTFSKAEHLKRNADQAEDPRAVYQAMRPVFSDLVAEIIKSINFFYSLEKDAKITRAITMGNAMKLPGLESYLAKNLKDASKKSPIEVTHIESFPGLVGPSVLTAPSFKENQFSFGTCYGLALQGIGRARLKTNLIPVELLTDRLIKGKKPWIVAAVSMLMLGICVNFFGGWTGAYVVRPKKYETVFGEVKAVKSKSDKLHADYDGKVKELTRIASIGDRLAEVRERRMLWPEFLAALAQCLPKEKKLDDPKERDPKYQKSIGARNEMYIERIDCQYVEKLEDYYAGVRKEAGLDSDADGPVGEGWVVQISGYHYFNEIRARQGAEFVRSSLMKNLTDGTVKIPVPAPKGAAAAQAFEEIKVAHLGISHPVLVGNVATINDIDLPDPNDPGDGKTKKKIVKVKRFDFDLQLCWIPKTASVRAQEAKARKIAEEEAEKNKALAEDGAVGE